MSAWDYFAGFLCLLFVYGALAMIWEKLTKPKQRLMHMDPRLDVQSGRDKPGWYADKPPEE
jgi:hypothetical protein